MTLLRSVMERVSSREAREWRWRDINNPLGTREGSTTGNNAIGVLADLGVEHQLTETTRRFLSSRRGEARRGEARTQPQPGRSSDELADDDGYLGNT